uniref:Transcription elongation factor Spt5 n=1 Tax=Ignisphaera aggregans TaxID=334771 RepID=A0A7C2VNC6_9CREN
MTVNPGEAEQKPSTTTPSRNTLFIVRTTAGQEINVALLIETRTKAGNIPLYSILALPNLKGYVVIEARGLHSVYEAIRGLKHVKGRVSGTLRWDDLEAAVRPKPMIELLYVGADVEVVAGPFRGMKAKVTAIDKTRNEVSLNILEANYPLTITVPVDYIRLLKGEK